MFGRLVMVAAAQFVVLQVIPQDAEAEEGREVLDEAKRLGAAGRNAEAEALLVRFCDEHPDDRWAVAAHLKIAFLCRSRRAFADQLRHAESALAKVDRGEWRETAELLQGYALASLGRGIEGRPILERLEGAAQVAAIRERAAEALATVRLLGEPPPDLAVDRWVRTDERGLATGGLRGLAGKVVLVEFFQKGCHGCAEAAPHLASLESRFRDRGFFTIGVGVRFEAGGERAAQEIARWLESDRHGHDALAVDHDASESFRRFKAEGTPWIALLDREGKLVHLGFFDEVVIPELVARLVERDSGEHHPEKGREERK